jgi:hypothetical protein
MPAHVVHFFGTGAAAGGLLRHLLESRPRPVVNAYGRDRRLSLARLAQKESSDAAPGFRESSHSEVK